MTNKFSEAAVFLRINVNISEYSLYNFFRSYHHLHAQFASYGCILLPIRSAADEPHAVADVGETTIGAHVEPPAKQLQKDANPCTSPLLEELMQK